MKINAYSPILWSSGIILSILCYGFAFHFFPQTFPIIHLDISMNLEQALTKANDFTTMHHYGPQKHQSAAMFYTDTISKTFIELEAGGHEAFVTMMDNNLYMPYTWNVRHFKESDKNETLVRFTPDGTLYGFIETISENDHGAQLTEQQAQKLAEQAFITWNIDFTSYKCVETSQKVQPSTRIDHTFIYERTDAVIGEGFYRLKIQVSGDKITELTHFIKVPETFTRRYKHMRSANTIIAWAATIIMILLYVLGGCCVGLYFITRQKWAMWKQALRWAILIACISTLAFLNQLPFLWMQYNSAQSSQGFLIQLLLGALLSTIAQACIFSIIIAAAESLTRKAFGHHPQLWSLWSLRTSSSYALLGRTIGAYLLVGFNVAFVIAFYLFSTRYLGWWTPSELLFNPNILATYIPWFSPLALSLQAGFTEECLFRALPLAGAALLGERFGKKNIWIGAAFILQAVIFGAAHATYPTQPAYSRVIELLIPSFIWGALYLRFGLLLTIITHTVYDIIWFSIPIFASSSPQALPYKLIIIISSLIPLLRVFYARIRNGSWTTLNTSETNAAWQPSAAIEKPQEKVEITINTQQHISIQQKCMIFMGLLGIIVWLHMTPFTHDGLLIQQTQDEAIAAVRPIIMDKIYHAPSTGMWQTLPLFFTHYTAIPSLHMQHKFIWQHGKKELYHQLLGTHLEPPHWTIRYAHFHGDLIQRAEEHMILLYDTTRYVHKMPESAMGKQLSKEQARPLAHAVLVDHFNLNPQQLIEISAQAVQHPNRKDWHFIFSNPAVYPLSEGQARIVIIISGDTIADAARIIHVPEAWERNEQNNTQKLGIIYLIIAMLLALIIALGTFIAHKNNTTTTTISRNFFIIIWITLSALSYADIVNVWPSIIGACNTIEPLFNQLMQKLSTLFIVTTLKSMVIALVISWILNRKEHTQLPKTFSTMSLGIAIGVCLAALKSISQQLLPALEPLWPNYTPLGMSIPIIADIIQNIFRYVGLTLCYSLITIIINDATFYWHKNKLLFSFLFLLSGLTFNHLSSLAVLPLWLTMGAATGSILFIFYRSFIRYDNALIPLITGSITIFNTIQQGMFNAYPGAVHAAFINICIVICLSSIWFKHMNKQKSI